MQVFVSGNCVEKILLYSLKNTKEFIILEFYKYRYVNSRQCLKTSNGNVENNLIEQSSTLVKYSLSVH